MKKNDSISMIKRLTCLTQLLGRLNVHFTQPVTDVQLDIFAPVNARAPDSADSIHSIIVSGNNIQTNTNETIYIKFSSEDGNWETERKHVKAPHHQQMQICDDMEKSFDGEKEKLDSQRSIENQKIQALDKIFEESEFANKYNNTPSGSDEFSLPLMIPKNSLEFSSENEKEIQDLETERERVKKELRKEYPEDVFVKGMIAKAKDIVHSQKQLRYRCHVEQNQIRKDFKEKHITQEMFQARMEVAGDSLKNPYMKLNVQLATIRKEIEGQVQIVKNELRYELKILDEKLAKLNRKLSNTLRLP